MLFDMWIEVHGYKKKFVAEKLNICRQMLGKVIKGETCSNDLAMRIVDFTKEYGVHGHVTLYDLKPELRPRKKVKEEKFKQLDAFDERKPQTRR